MTANVYSGFQARETCSPWRGASSAPRFWTYTVNTVPPGVATLYWWLTPMYVVIVTVPTMLFLPGGDVARRERSRPSRAERPTFSGCPLGRDPCVRDGDGAAAGQRDRAHAVVRFLDLPLEEVRGAEEPRHELGRRVLVDDLGLAELLDLAVAHDREPVAMVMASSWSWVT